MVAFARRLTGVVLTLSMVVGLPIAAARAGCVCDHGHTRAFATPDPADCPMHHRDGRSAHAPTPQRAAGSMRCACAGEAQTLINQATVVGVLPAAVTVDAPVFAPPSESPVAEAPRRLGAAPPAPPPRV